MEFLTVEEGHTVTLETGADAQPERVHVFSRREIDAVNAALGAGRPLLVRGEPGVGKTQLAEAAAVQLQRLLLPFVVDARSESRDLLWHLDAVQRLADAQLLGAAGELRRDGQAPADDPGDPEPPVRRLLFALREALALENYLHPGPLWWAFDWEGAGRQAAAARISPPSLAAPAAGCVVLIDEIDKAESDLPNGLLEALGARCFRPQGRTAPVRAVGELPLVIVTTNEERTLPDAFVRRCLVLHLRLPDGDPEALARHLMGRGRAHFPAADPGVLERAARLLARDRATAEDNQWYPLPGQAEYLDLVRAVRALETEPPAQLRRLDDLGRYLLKKHPEAARAADRESGPERGPDAPVPPA